jgi:predicted Zn-dependent protease
MLRWKRRHDRSTAAFCAALALATWLAYASPAQAYKVQVTEQGASVHWHTSTITLRIAPDLEAYLGDIPVVEAVTEAAAAWSELKGVPEILVSGGCPDAPGAMEDRFSNGVYLVQDWTLWPNALAATITTFETETGKLVDADVQINANYGFSWLSPDGGEVDRYDLLAVLTHELGHVLGLGDASDAPGATMWPSLAPGDIYQRDLAPDDEAGAESIYPSLPAHAMLRGAGCGRASVLLPPSHAETDGAMLTVLVLALALWVWSRARRSSKRHAVVLGGALLFGGLVAPNAPAPRAPVTDRELARVHWLPLEHPAAQLRLETFVAGAERLFKGRAVVSAQRRAGLIWTRVRVQGGVGSADFEVPGGSLDGLTQIVSGQAPPREGEQLVIAWRKHAPHGWAHLQDGRVYGGSLGEGPALEWE